MNYYVIQVKSRFEEKYIQFFKSIYPESGLKLYFPKRELKIMKAGKVKISRFPVFPGYIFIEASADEIIFSQWKIKKIDGFFRFLVSNRNITPLSANDVQLAKRFIDTPDSLAGVSKVYFDENSRIVVIEGILAGLEGRIIKVDKRKGRAKVKLDLYEDSFAIDLAFEVMGSAKEGIKP